VAKVPNFAHPKLADILDKCAKLYATKFITTQFCQTLTTPNFYHLQ